MDLLLATSGGEAQAAQDRLYVDDVFSAYTYAGDGNDAQQIVNDINLAAEGGMVWVKNRSSIVEHILTSTGLEASGGLWNLRTNETGAAYPNFWASGLTMNPDGFIVKKESAASISTNGINNSYASWTFRQAHKFFDVVTYTGNGASNRALSHQLNADVGMVMVKATSATGDWWVFHRSATGDLVLNTTAAQTASKANIPSATSSTFTVNGSANTNGVQYVAYLFAHDPSAEGIIQCGSFTTDGSAVDVSLGFEPAFLLTRRSNVADNWTIIDGSRGFLADGGSPSLMANSSAAEGSYAFAATSTGFRLVGSVSGTFIYLAIRRPNKPPTSGTQVYNAIARTGTGAAATVTGVGFAPDLVASKTRNVIISHGWFDRLRGALQRLSTNSTNTETVGAGGSLTGFDNMGGVILGSDPDSTINASGATYINHFFRRAKGFFDIVCYTGNGASRTVNHNLAAVPEIWIAKNRNSTTGYGHWFVGHKDLGPAYTLLLNGNQPKDNGWPGGVFGGVYPTSSAISLSGSDNANGVGTSYVAYLFASLPGISKVGSYTGNGTSQTINCGFSTGARFILIKRTDSTGDWYVWDTVRGIVAANDPHLSLNTTAAEVTTDDSVDPEASGFIVNQNTATNINVNGGQYIFLAIA